MFDSLFRKAFAAALIVVVSQKIRDWANQKPISTK
jgi:hypothetical protein